jgi:hypothetical protein
VTHEASAAQGALISAIEDYIWWITAGSVLTALATLLAIPWLVTRLPADYFDHRHRENLRGPGDKPLSGLLLSLSKNLLGAALLALGLVMLVTPGQGVLTILVGLLLMNFPGKYRLERWLVTRPGVLKSLNGLRRRRGKPPFHSP